MWQVAHSSAILASVAEVSWNVCGAAKTRYKGRLENQASNSFPDHGLEISCRNNLFHLNKTDAEQLWTFALA